MSKWPIHITSSGMVSEKARWSYPPKDSPTPKPGRRPVVGRIALRVTVRHSTWGAEYASRETNAKEEYFKRERREPTGKWEDKSKRWKTLMHRGEIYRSKGKGRMAVKTLGVVVKCGRSSRIKPVISTPRAVNHERKFHNRGRFRPLIKSITQSDALDKQPNHIKMDVLFMGVVCNIQIIACHVENFVEAWPHNSTRSNKVRG